jgi:hypothetical protein
MIRGLKYFFQIYFMDDVALLLIVKFSASDASELSRSPVRTFPDCACCGAAPGIIGCCVKPELVVVVVEDCPLLSDDAGFSTSPNGSKPFSC